MELRTKPDLAEARQRWQAFWHHEIIGRPVVCTTGPKGARPSTPHPRHFPMTVGDVTSHAGTAKAIAEATFWAGEAIPFQGIGFGPDQYAAYLGATLEYSPSSTNHSESRHSHGSRLLCSATNHVDKCVAAASRRNAGSGFHGLLRSFCAIW